ncbi:filamentous hemagglutinin, partial [bacterium]|nr:filamentous hemagglutinin [bacterium]NBX50911.1 filamentous hemagglutinin [bacterium]
EGDTLSGSLDRAPGEDVGTYAIDLGDLDNANYDITFVTDDLSIDQKALTVTADPQSKTYGDADPELTYSTVGLVEGDTLSGSLDRVEGEDVGSYAINQGDLDNANYDITFNSDDLTVSKKALTVTADPQSKTYGDADPELTYSADGLVEGDTLSGSLDRAPGEDVGSYAIDLGDLDNSNYDITFNSDDLTVSKKALTVTADPQSKTYGDTDPELTYTTDGLVSQDSLTGSLSREEGEDVGGYAINQGTLDNANYDITFITDDLTVSKKALTINAEAKSKTYGDTDPTLTYTTSGLINSDTLSGSLDRDAGENVGSYAISQGTLANSNYEITFNTANLTISKKSVTVTAEAKSKTYGDTDPTLTYTTDGLVGADSLTGSLTRDAGENVGSYAINQGTLDNANYDITFNSDDLTVSKKALTVTAEAKSKIYGDNDPALTYTTSGLINSDTLTGSLDRAAGENVGSYAINQGTLDNANYDITFNSDDLTISKKAVIVTADPQSKTYGSNDPTLTFTTLGLSGGDTLSGSLDRAAGENVGTYAINQGTLEASANYVVTFTGADLTISKKALTITANPVSKKYGDADPELTYSTDGLVEGDTLSGSLDRAPGEDVGTYAIDLGDLDNANYD